MTRDFRLLTAVKYDGRLALHAHSQNRNNPFVAIGAYLVEGVTDTTAVGNAVARALNESNLQPWTMDQELPDRDATPDQLATALLDLYATPPPPPPLAY